MNPLSSLACAPDDGAARAPRLGRHHFAHLRGVAEGLPLLACAQRYLGIEHGHQAASAHRRVVEHLRALSRRRGDRAWRLIGLNIRLPQAAPRPSLEDFIAERELHGWAEAEVQQLYADAHPPDTRTERRQRLRERQLMLLRELELAAAETPLPSDRIDGWFDPATAARLASAGLLLLADLQARIRHGGAWWNGLPAIGRTKAARLAAYLNTLLPTQPADALPVFGLPSPTPAPAPTPAPTQTLVPREPQAPTVPDALAESRRDAAPLPATAAALTTARTDLEALNAWVSARAGSAATALSYRREGLRLLLWLEHERAGRRLAQMSVEDCLAYMAFLEHLPPEWISRRHRSVLAPGWAPFRGPLSWASQRQAVSILSGFFAWLVASGYLPGRNPWLLVNRRTGDDAGADLLDSRAFTPEAWTAMLAHLRRQPPGASRERMLFLLTFVEATGLRASELVEARLGALRRHRGRWVMQVHGKGARNRLVAVPSQAELALDDYLRARGLPALGQVDPALPLLASTRDACGPIGYQALYQTMKRWVREAILASGLSRSEQEVALRASPHWLRHTFGTRALERKAPLEAVQRQLGHADPRTTMRYARTQIERLQTDMEAAFGTASRPAGRSAEVAHDEVGSHDQLDLAAHRHDDLAACGGGQVEPEV